MTTPGDGVVIMPPVYRPFFEIIANAERRVVEVPFMGDDGRCIDWEGLDEAFLRDARALLLCHPHNPLGRVFSLQELERIATLAQRHGILVISDEIHAPLRYSGARHVPFAVAGEPVGLDIVTLMSASKGWNIAGLKCAQMVAGSARVHECFERLPADVTDRIGHLGVIATMAAYEHGHRWLQETLAQLDENRRLLAILLSEHLPQIGYRIPEATYLAWLDCRELGLGENPAQTFLERGRVALSRGLDFGAPGRECVRLNFATSAAIITEAVDRMAHAVGSR